MPSEPFLGDIIVFAGNFAPRGWAFCAGQLMPISQNTALFSLLGTTYGGNGTTTFALPNFQGIVPMSQGNGPGLSPRVWGEQGGATNVTLLQTEMPQHNHSVQALTANGDGNTASGGQLAKAFKGSFSSGSSGKWYSGSAPNASMSPLAVSAAGGNQAHNNMQPYLALSFIIALTGIFPARN